MCLAQGHDTVTPVGIEPRTSRFGPTLYHYATALPVGGFWQDFYFGKILEKCKWDSQNNTKKVQVGKDQEKAQSEKDSHSKNRGGKKPN